MKNNKIHPFERSGCGIGPFKFVCSISLPSPSMQEHNPSLAHSQKVEATSQARSFGVGIGTCHHCGMALMNNCVIRDSRGKHFIVGCVCVKKTGDAFLGGKAKIAEAKFQRERNAEKRQIREEKWLAAPSKENPAKTNAEIKQEQIDQRNAKREQAELERKERIKLVCRKWNFWVVQILVSNKSGGSFVQSIVSDLKQGSEPRGRGLDICAEIFAKTFGRANSEAFKKAHTEFWENIEEKVEA